MNSTAWSSLAGLCKFLGRQGKCVVDETEKGWYLQYIDKGMFSVSLSLSSCLHQIQEC
jgi:hypothetical protein